MRKLYFILVNIGCLLLAVSCSDKANNGQTIQSVKLDTVVANNARSYMQYPGRVKAAQDVDIAFRVSGTIQKIHVKDGQRVRAGQLLAELDPSDYKVQLDATEAKYKQIKAEAERVTALYNDGGTTPNDYDKATYGLQQITALYQHHKDELSYTKLRAPFDGFIQRHLFEQHETLAAGMPVLSMISSGTPEVEINLPAAEYIRKEYFETFHCTFELYPGRTYPLKLIGISRKANANQLYTMRLQLQSGDMPMPSPGMNTMVSIFYVDVAQNLMQVPSGAIVRKGDNSYVYVYSAVDSKVHLKEVKMLRPLNNGKTIVSSEVLHPGDEIVSAGVHFIKDGEQVKPVTPITKTNIGGLL